MNFFHNSTPVTEGEILEAESHFGVKMPDSLRNLVFAHNGATWVNESGMVDSLISMSRRDAFNAFTLSGLPYGYLPFADDGREGVFAVSGHEGEGIVHFADLANAPSKKGIAASFEVFLEMLDGRREST